MAKLNLSVAIGDYDRTRALLDGAVAIDGVDPVYMALIPEEIFFRAFRAAEFDICEMSLSSYTVKTAQDNCPYIAVPAFVSRAFRHTSIYVRTDRVKKPDDLKGRKVGVPEYQLTANVWARALPRGRLRRQAADIHWIRGGIEEPDGRRSSRIKLPPACGSTTRRRARRFPSCLRAGEIDGFIAPRPPALIDTGQCEHRLAVPRSGRGGQGLFQAHRHFSDHACGRRAPHARREASVAAGRGAQGVRAGEGGGARQLARHVGDQGDAAVRRRALTDARAADGRRLLVLRRRAEPQGARLLSQPASCAGTVVAALTVDELFHPATYETFKV